MENFRIQRLIKKRLRRHVILFISACILSILSLSCSTDDTDNISTNNNNNVSELTDSSLANINSMFSKIDFMDTTYTFERGYFVNPKFNETYIVESDTANFIFLKLFERSDSVLIAVNKLLCYATVLPKFEGSYYPNESIIYPYDFRFLNENKPSLNINCINEDDHDYRMVGYYKGLIGTWIVDSVESVRKHYEFDSSLATLEFSKEKVILNDTIKADYLHSGFTLRIEDFPFDFYKIFMNGNKSIFINTYQDSYEVFYLSKIKQ